MSPLIAVLALQATYTSPDSLWQGVIKAHKGFSSFAYKVQVVHIDSKGKSKLAQHGTLSYERKGEVTFLYRDNIYGIDATMSRGKDGKWDQSARDDVNSTNAANNALGYCDSMPDRWSYAPVLFMEDGEVRHVVSWKKGAPTELTFRNVSCYLVQGKENKYPIKVWIERKRLTLLRTEEDFGKFKRVTAFENVKAS